jgi:hypothetical protein
MAVLEEGGLGGNDCRGLGEMRRRSWGLQGTKESNRCRYRW